MIDSQDLKNSLGYDGVNESQFTYSGRRIDVDAEVSFTPYLAKIAQYHAI